MATFTDLSLSTQAGDPVVSTLTAGLDRNQIAAFEGDPTATVLIQAQNDAFTPASITTNKLGPFADGSSLAGVDSIVLAGDWGNYTGLGGTRALVKRFTRAGTYRIVCELGFSSDTTGATLGSAKMQLISSVNGSLETSDTADTLNTFVYIDRIVTVVDGESLSLLGQDGDNTSINQPQFKMRFKIFEKTSSVEAPKTVGWELERHRVVVIGETFPTTFNIKHIDWTSTPYPGNIS
jgi:hypothetical protein